MTEKITCPFYFKIGACRHGDRCSRIHDRPIQSPTILLKNMYYNPASHMSVVDGQSLEYDDVEATAQFDEFMEDISKELSKFGPLEEVNVCDNLGEHLMGNVYVRFIKEEDAKKALQNLNGRYYAGKPIFGEFSPVINFREARCRQYDIGGCSRGGFCNFLHIKKPTKQLAQKLFPNQSKEFEKYSRNKDKERDGENRRERDRGRDREKERDKHRSHDSEKHRSHDSEKHRSHDSEKHRSRESEKNQSERGKDKYRTSSNSPPTRSKKQRSKEKEIETELKENQEKVNNTSSDLEDFERHLEQIAQEVQQKTK